MPANRNEVFEAIIGERKFQDRKWGTIDQHPHEVGGWLTLMRKLLTDAEAAWSASNGDRGALDEVRKLLAVGVACCEQHGIERRSLHVAIADGEGRQGINHASE